MISLKTVFNYIKFANELTNKVSFMFNGIKKYVVRIIESLFIPATITSGVFEYIPNSGSPSKNAAQPVTTPVIATQRSELKSIFGILLYFPAPMFWPVNDTAAW